jgi:hypothetical protein
MNRESDEECLKLIAEVRARVYAGIPTPTQVERLLGNLEARIREREGALHYAPCVEEIGSLRVQLADLGIEFVKLTGEVERLHSVCVIKDEEIASLRSELAGARQKIDAMRDDPQPAEDERVTDAMREYRAAKADEPTLIGKDASAQACAEFAAANEQAYREAEQGAIGFRDIIREEVESEVVRQLVAQWEAGRDGLSFSEIIRQQVAAEVERQCGEHALCCTIARKTGTALAEPPEGLNRA